MKPVEDIVEQSLSDRILARGSYTLPAICSAGFAITAGITGYDAITDPNLRGHAIVLTSVAAGASTLTAYMSYYFAKLQSL